MVCLQGLLDKWQSETPLPATAFQAFIWRIVLIWADTVGSEYASLIALAIEGFSASKILSEQGVMYHILRFPKPLDAAVMLSNPIASPLHKLLNQLVMCPRPVTKGFMKRILLGCPEPKIGLKDALQKLEVRIWIHALDSLIFLVYLWLLDRCTSECTCIVFKVRTWGSPKSPFTPSTPHLSQPPGCA